MRKILITIFLLILILSNTYPQVQDFTQLKNQLMREASALRSHLATTKDIVFVSSMWDSCLIAINQIDAYFFMIGIINARKATMNEEAIGYLFSWLERMEKLNNTNLRSLADQTKVIESGTIRHMKKLEEIFRDFNLYIGKEKKRVGTLKELLTRRNRIERLGR